MDRILMAHGGGGRLMRELIEQCFAKAFGMEELGDSAILEFSGRRLALTTDSYVVSPLFFPGGNIGTLAVNGTVNDLAVSGATPLYLTSGFIIEEGFPISELSLIVESMARAAEEAGVRIVTGDTKVVNKGKGDGVFINTAGVGIIEDGVDISPLLIKTGDAVIVNGDIGSHGICIMAARNGLTFAKPLLSDCRPLNGLTQLMMKTAAVHFMRDSTRGGIAATLKEAASASGKCIKIKESSIPIAPQVRGACELLGLDPIHIANEGVVTAIVEKADAEALITAMKSHPYGANATIIGEVVSGPRGLVTLETTIGGTRVLDMPLYEQLPRIC
ncbi:MAG: hydrogenase expression/formation protein HypE [Nitrospirae bacterium]|nr:hydrogenase expression/formation protein HypE [Nitrospirota bacterium]